MTAARRPTGLDSNGTRVIGRPRPLMTQDVRAIDWTSDATDTVVRKIRAAEGYPGVLDELEGTDFHLFGAHRETTLRGTPGEIIAQRHGAICRATVDGAVWVTHLRRSGPQHTHFKLPATLALNLAGRELEVPDVPVPLDGGPQGEHTYRDIFYEEDARVGYLHFDFYNGAMSTDQCTRLREAYLYARSRWQTKVIVLMGGSDFFSNGIHLNVIEAAGDPAAESWRNLEAMNDLVREIVETKSHLVVSALAGDAAAGGVPLALAADHVYARDDVVLNPYYRHMGGLYGSEYWTYLLPRRVGGDMTARLTGPPFARSAPRGRSRSGCWTPRSAQPSRASRSRPVCWPSVWPRTGPWTTASMPSAAGGLATSRSSRFRPTEPRRWLARTNVSSGRTPAITRHGGALPASSGRPKQPRCSRALASPRDGGRSYPPAASSASAQSVKYSMRTIVPSRNVVTWWYISVSSSAPLPLPRP